MIRRTSTVVRTPRPVLSRSKRVQPSAASMEQPYGKGFWLAYVSNLFLTTANATLFRYGDFIAIGGGTELTLGVIVGAGMVGSILMRGVQGVGVDVYGVRKVWLWSSVGFVVSLLGHLVISQADNPALFLLRILYQTSVAGIFGASITFISRRSPLYRMAEVVGTLGTSGFLGMVLGALLVDRLFGAGAVTPEGVDRMFLAAAALGSLSGIFAWLATGEDGLPSRRRHVPIVRIVRRYNPGSILVISVVMGFGLGLASTFLRPYAASLNIANIGTFFSVYAITAFATRLSIRRLPERIGIRAMILIGIACLAIDMLLYLPVRTNGHLIVPAILIGIAHALLFPAVVAGGSAAFPNRYRGIGTALMLAMFDFGMFIGSPTVGSILHISDLAGLPKYPVMFVSLALLFTGVGVWYALTSRSRPAPSTLWRQQRAQRFRRLETIGFAKVSDD